MNRVDDTYYYGAVLPYRQAMHHEPSFPLKVQMHFSVYMAHSKEANHMLNPAQILIDAGKDYKNGHYVMGTLGIIAVIPGLEEIKFL